MFTITLLLIYSGLSNSQVTGYIIYFTRFNKVRNLVALHTMLDYSNYTHLGWSSWVRSLFFLFLLRNYKMYYCSIKSDCILCSFSLLFYLLKYCSSKFSSQICRSDIKCQLVSGKDEFVLKFFSSSNYICYLCTW